MSQCSTEKPVRHHNKKNSNEKAEDTGDALGFSRQQMTGDIIEQRLNEKE
jgi:hypothetical protein